jgi:two-component system sensor histidine kinase ArlS
LMFVNILVPAAIVGGLGLVFGIGLAAVSKKFALAANDERIEQIIDVLPGANCGACGYTGCVAYATAVVNEGAKTNLCTVGKDAVVKKISSKVAKNLLSPLRELSQTLRQISESNMTSRINVTDCKYELKEIAQSFNQMMDSIEASYQKQKQFVSDASHELRTPISVIQGYAHMLNRWGKNDPKVMEEAIEAIMEETENMKDLVEKLLFIARSDKSTFQLEKTPFDLSSLVSDLIKEFSLIAPKKQFVFKPFASPVVTADKNRIKEAYRIIMDNAVKYTGSNGVITLSVFLEGNFACVSIADNGPGIPKEELPKIFDRFYSRNRGSKEAESKSHGLGLALAKIIVLAHGGKITVKSTLNIGTEFIVKIPVK